MAKGSNCKGVTYWKNPTPDYACPVCANRLGRFTPADCKEHTAEEKADYRERENKTK